MTDVLAPLPVAQVAAWYRRLANATGTRRLGGQPPLSSRLLNLYLDNRVPTKTYKIDPPNHLVSSPYVLDMIRYHRRVFLTQDQAELNGRQFWAGIVPRLQGASGFPRCTPPATLQLEFQKLVEIPLRLQLTGTEEEKDLLTSLHGFQLRSKVVVALVPVPLTTLVTVYFSSWICTVLDRYDFDYSEHFTVPNPDYGSARADAVTPTEVSVTVFHSNARRLEAAGLAAPYNLEMLIIPTDSNLYRADVVNSATPLATTTWLPEIF